MRLCVCASVHLCEGLPNLMHTREVLPPWPIQPGAPNRVLYLLHHKLTSMHACHACHAFLLPRFWGSQISDEIVEQARAHLDSCEYGFL